MVNAFLSVCDMNRISVLILDLLAAFDTLDHGILLQCLCVTFGLSDASLKWFQSYLSDCNQSVVVEGTSLPVPLKYRVPQGSVLEPFLFGLLVLPLSLCHTSHSADRYSFSFLRPTVLNSLPLSI